MVVNNDGLAPAIREIERLTKEAKAKENRIIEIGGKFYNAQDLTRIFNDDPRPEPIRVSSLSALAEYAAKEYEKTKIGGLFAHVVSPTQVQLLEDYKGESADRSCYVEANLENDITPFIFGKWLPTETFIISLYSLFEQTEDRDLVVKVASCLVDQSRLKAEDSGLTQTMQATAGVINESGVESPNVADLKPFRTFRQIEQPNSPFLFRFKAEGGEIKCALLEADGGAWKHVAMERIKEYLAEAAPGLRIMA